LNNRVLLYADDPGAANYLHPLRPALEQAGYRCRYVVSPALGTFVRERNMNAEIRYGASARSLLADIDLLLVGTSEDRECFSHELTDVAKLQGVPSVGVVDMTVNAARRFQGTSENPLRYVPSWLAVPDAVCRDAYIRLGYPIERVVVCGHPHYDVVRSKREALLLMDRGAMRDRIYPNAPPGRPIWLFLAEGVDRLDPAQSFRNKDYTLAGRGDSDFRACIVLEELLDATAELSPQPWVVLRPHPKSELEDFASVLDELGAVNQGGDPLDAVWAADRVVGMTTMLLQETLLLERPHFSILPRRAEMHWLPTLELGLTPFVSTRTELRARLRSPATEWDIPAETLSKGALGRILKMVTDIA
jgi:hypothetical protein